jgi:hypothetical protein
MVIAQPVFKLPPLPSHVANSSDTEEDSQCYIAKLQRHSSSRVPLDLGPSPANDPMPNSSDTEDDPEGTPVLLIHLQS